MKVNMNRTEPQFAGYYLAFMMLTGKFECIHIVYDLKTQDLINLNGGSTHFSRWNCIWSERLEIERTDY